MPRHALRWTHAVRIIASAYPPIERFDRVADPDDFVALIQLEQESNPRLLEQLGDVTRVPSAQWAKGPGASYVMAAFTHVSPWGSRFAAPDAYGVYYCAQDEATAIAETVYHRERTSRESQDPPQVFDQRVLVAKVRARIVDLRGRCDDFPDVYDLDDYGPGQELGRIVHSEAGADGVAFDSVRHDGGRCVALFNPSTITECRHVKYLEYRFDGQHITVFEVKLARPAQASSPVSPSS